ncbi:MAG: EAL domain-containing protein [Marinobacterium sp.]|nr:EAL domain-containing protein [Marinobacterium sp.]
MSLQLDAKSLPRFQAAGMVGIVLFLTLVISGYFIFKFQTDNEQRLQAMHDGIYAEQKKMLQREIQSARNYIKYMYDQAETELIFEARQQVEQAYTIAQSIYDAEKGKRSDAEIQALIRETLRDVRFFHGRGYLFVDDMDGNVILLPTTPDLEGRSLYNNQDDTGFYIMRGLIEKANSPAGEGVVRYRWYPPGDQTEMVDKIAYVKKFKPYNWLIGTGDYIYRIQNDLKEKALQRISATRFGDSGYIAVLSSEYRSILSSAARPDSSDPFNAEQERTVVRELLNFAENGGGFYQYTWFYPGSNQPVPKLSLVSKVEQTDWVLVAGIYPGEIEAAIAKQQRRLEQNIRQDMWILLGMLTAAAIITLLLALLFAGWFRRLFHRYQQNIESQQAALKRNAQALEIAARVFDNANEGILVTNPDGVIVAANPALSRITGYSTQELIGERPSLLSSGQHDSYFFAQLWQQLREEGYWQGEIWNRRKNGEIYPQWLSITTSKDPRGEIANYVAAVTDISERKNAEQQLQYLADYDSLTDLPNRRLFGRKVDQAVLRCQQHLQQQFALIFIDLDRFKNINDSLGHAAGDQVLQSVARRLSQAINPGDTVSRLGGDEFVILINHQNARAEALRLAERLLISLSEPILVDNQELAVTPSQGVAVYPQHGKDFDTLLRNADAALYAAKDNGRNNVQFYTDELNSYVSARLTLENELREALHKDQFELYYQPQSHLDSGEICGYEALIRWHHPDKGLISPSDFIELAEETGQIRDIGSWVLNTACQQAADWEKSGYKPLPMSVNVSSQQFTGQFISIVRQALERSGMNPALLTLELTESTLIDNLSTATSTLLELKQLGLSIALDDFGTGYSSLTYLKRFPVDKLKIDRSFVSGLPHNRDDGAITHSIIDVAHNLGLETIAEGVETRAQQNCLQNFGCNQAQGYLFARPLPADEMERLLLDNTRSPTPA